MGCVSWHTCASGSVEHTVNGTGEVTNRPSLVSLLETIGLTATTALAVAGCWDRAHLANIVPELLGPAHVVFRLPLALLVLALGIAPCHPSVGPPGKGDPPAPLAAPAEPVEGACWGERGLGLPPIFTLIAEAAILAALNRI